MKRLLTSLILIDAAQTYIAVGHLGAREFMLWFVNQEPLLIWLVAFVKVLAVLYLVKYMNRYRWIEYVLHAAIFTHAVIIISNTYWLLFRLFVVR